MGLSFQDTTKRTAVFLAALVLAITMSVGMTACGSDDSQQNQNASSTQESASSAEQSKVALAIDKSAIENGTVENFDIEVADGDTVLTMLDKAGVSYESEDSSYGPFVTTIDSLSNGDQGSMSGWTYTVNGEYPSTSADNTEVKAGDSVTWTFTTGEEYDQ